MSIAEKASLGQRCPIGPEPQNTTVTNVLTSRELGLENALQKVAVPKIIRLHDEFENILHLPFLGGKGSHRRSQRDKEHMYNEQSRSLSMEAGSLIAKEPRLEASKTSDRFIVSWLCSGAQYLS